jgi:hypothetical protein
MPNDPIKAPEPKSCWPKGGPLAPIPPRPWNIREPLPRDYKDDYRG